MSGSDAKGEPRFRPLCAYNALISDAQQQVGVGPAGRRMIAVVSGGVVEGERLRGRVLPGGGDWALIDADDVLRLDARISFETHDGAVVYVSYRGVIRPWGAAARAAGEAPYFRTTPVFETGDRRYAWLNGVVALGLGRIEPDGVRYDVFEVL